VSIARNAHFHTNEMVPAVRLELTT
jgi:hypothetical protein